MSVPLQDCSNAPLRDVAKLAIADADAVGCTRVPDATIQHWLDTVGFGRATTLDLVLKADAKAQAAIASQDPQFAMALSAHRESIVRAMPHVIVQTRRLRAVQQRFIRQPAVAKLLAQQPRWLDRAMIAAAAIEYQLPIIGGNRFYMRLAEVKGLPHGAFDIRKGEWIVEPRP